MIRRGTPPAEAVEVGKTKLTVFETALIMEGVPAARARFEVSQPLSTYDIKASISYLMEKKGMDIHHPIATGKRLIDASQRAPMTKAQAYDASFAQANGTPLDLSPAFIQADGTLLDFSLALPVVVADAVLNRSRPRTVPSVEADMVASAPRLDSLSSAKVAVLSGVSGEVLPTAARAAEPPKPNPVNALIMKALKGEGLREGDVKQIQGYLNGLKDKKFSAGTEDGILGAKTWEAVARYARAGNLAGEKVDTSHLRHLEASLKTIGYAHIKVDGNIKDDSETRRALGRFFEIRTALKDLKPVDVTAPDIAAMAAVQAGYAKKRGIAAG